MMLNCCPLSSLASKSLRWWTTPTTGRYCDSQRHAVARLDGHAAAARSSSALTSLSTAPEASRERFATCRQPHGNREGPTFLSASTAHHPGVVGVLFLPFVVFAKDRPFYGYLRSTS